MAVRSSALDEGGRRRLVAGQHETVLNPIGADALEEAIVRCWRSLDEERALADQAQPGLSVERTRLAVLAQPASAPRLAKASLRHHGRLSGH